MERVLDWKLKGLGSNSGCALTGSVILRVWFQRPPPPDVRRGSDSGSAPLQGLSEGSSELRNTNIFCELLQRWEDSVDRIAITSLTHFRKIRIFGDTLTPILTFPQEVLSLRL